MDYKLIITTKIAGKDITKFTLLISKLLSVVSDLILDDFTLFFSLILNLDGLFYLLFGFSFFLINPAHILLELRKPSPLAL